MSVAELDRTVTPSGVDKTPEEVHLYCDCSPGRDLCGRIPGPGEGEAAHEDERSCAICVHVYEVEGHCPYCGSYL